MEHSNSRHAAQRAPYSRNNFKTSAPLPPNPSPKPSVSSVNDSGGAKPAPPPLPSKVPSQKPSIPGTMTVGRNAMRKNPQRLGIHTGANSAAYFRTPAGMHRSNSSDDLANGAPPAPPPREPPAGSRPKPSFAVGIQVIESGWGGASGVEVIYDLLSEETYATSSAAAGSKSTTAIAVAFAAKCGHDAKL